MRFHSVSQDRWGEWEGEGYDPDPDTHVYFTLGYVDFEKQSAFEQLAKVLKDDGVVDSVYEGKEMLADGVTIVHGHVIRNGNDLYVREFFEDEVDGTEMEATWVEIPYA